MRAEGFHTIVRIVAGSRIGLQPRGPG
jgi:hypothetical protein